MKIAVQVLVKGRVQGVGYRWFACQNAAERDITGYVRNLSNGDVEVYAEGEEEDVEDFAGQLQKGPAFSRVTECVLNRMTPENKYPDFNVRY